MPDVVECRRCGRETIDPDAEPADCPRGIDGGYQGKHAWRPADV